MRESGWGCVWGQAALHMRKFGEGKNGEEIRAEFEVQYNPLWYLTTTPILVHTSRNILCIISTL